MDEAAQADRVVVMDGGNIIMDDVPKKIFSQVKKLRSVGLDVPQVTELCEELREKGVDISTEIIGEPGVRRGSVQPHKGQERGDTSGEGSRRGRQAPGSAGMRQGDLQVQYRHSV